MIQKERFLQIRCDLVLPIISQENALNPTSRLPPNNRFTLLNTNTMMMMMAAKMPIMIMLTKL